LVPSAWTLTQDGKSPKPKLGKPQTEPLALEAEFARVVLAAFERLESAATKIALRLTSELTTDAKDDDLRDLHGSFGFRSELATELVEKLNAHNARQVRRSIGLVAPEMTPKRLKAIAKRTLRRVRGIVADVSERLTVTVSKAAREGLRGNALADLIQRSLKVEREHAKNIAVGQVIQINSELTRERHQRLGVVAYVWRSVPDRHTRSWHRKLNGKTFSYDSPPEGGGGGPHDHGHPGTADRCRCQPIPVIPPPRK
jgi:SPP1 gp7 family putative phage head morphogenesis protein